MRRVLRNLGNTFETIGYHVERAANRRREDFITRQVRQMRWPLAVMAGLAGVLGPIIGVFYQNLSLLPALPPGVGAIMVAYTALDARTPNRRFGRMLIAVLL